MKTNRFYLLIVVFVCASLSLGAWWGGGKARKEVSNTKTTSEKPAFQKVDQKTEQQFKTDKKKFDVDLKKVSPEKKSVPQKDKDASTPIEVSTPGRRTEEVEKVQDELKEIINRTQHLQTKVRNNRLEIQNMLERAQIHEQILRNITLPPPIPTKQQVDPEGMINREKVRLIAEQAKQTQEQLRLIQQARSLTKASQVVPNEAKASKLS